MGETKIIVAHDRNESVFVRVETRCYTCTYFGVGGKCSHLKEGLNAYTEVTIASSTQAKTD